MSEDYDLAKQIAMDMKLELANMPGVYNIEDNMPYGRKELRIGLDEYRASLHGLTFQNLAMALRTANDGLVASTFKDPTRTKMSTFAFFSRRTRGQRPASWWMSTCVRQRTIG